MEDSLLEWWMIATLSIIAHDLNHLEFLLGWLGWHFRKSLFALPLFVQAQRAWNWLSVRPALACVLVGCAPIVIRLALLPIFPVPQPMVADEFSHLLVADTFLHGRLTNPTHALWTHFESIHIIQRPTYNSMYFPAQGAMLLVGALFGLPWLGLLLVTGLMCGMIVWALQPYMPSRWAILGGVIAGLRFGIVGYWINSYWGGSLAALCGAVILGCYGRSVRKPSLGLGVLLGLAFGTLGIVRPMEGLAYALPFAVAMLIHLVKSPATRLPFLTRVVLPATVLMGLLFGGLGVYFKALTGDPLTPGYAANQREYGWPLVMPWQKPSQLTFRHKELEIYYEWERGELKKKNGIVAIAMYGPFHLAMGWTFFAGPLLSIGLLRMRKVLANRRLRIIVISALSCATIVFIEAGYPHYLAPATACIIALIVQSLRYLRTSRGRFGGRMLVPIVVAVMVAEVGIHVVGGEWLRIPYTGTTQTYLSWCCVSTAGQDRKAVEKTVAATPGEHVILVKYHHKKFMTVEWVYNGADIDGSRIVWARDMGPERNLELIRYYKKRRFWLVDADDQKPLVQPYAVPLTADSTEAPSRSR